MLKKTTQNSISWMNQQKKICLTWQNIFIIQCELKSAFIKSFI
jgi:hypothetical protein